MSFFGELQQLQPAGQLLVARHLKKINITGLIYAECFMRLQGQ